MANITGLDNAAFSTSANVAHSKVQHRFRGVHSQHSTIAAATQYLGIVRGSTGLLLAINVRITETAPSGDHTVTINLKKSTGGGAFATVLSATIVLDSSTVALVSSVGAFSDNALQSGDELQLTVAVGGASGSQGSGLDVTVEWYETPS